MLKKRFYKKVDISIRQEEIFTVMVFHYLSFFFLIYSMIANTLSTCRHVWSTGLRDRLITWYVMEMQRRRTLGVLIYPSRVSKVKVCWWLWKILLSLLEGTMLLIKTLIFSKVFPIGLYPLHIPCWGCQISRRGGGG